MYDKSYKEFDRTTEAFNFIPSMKLKIALLIAASASFAHAHDEAKGHKHDHAPKAVISEKVTTGNGTFTFLASSTWGKLKDGKNLGPTHGGVAVDSQGLIYVTTDGVDSIYVYKADGTLVKTMAPQARGIHQLTIVKEGDTEYLYGAQLNAYGGKRIQQIIKLNLAGETQLIIPNKDTGDVQGGFGGMTGIAVAADGSIFGSMGYGSNLVHKFDKTGKLIKTFGGKGAQEDKFKTPHNVYIDNRFGEPRLLIADREKRRLVHFDLEGKFIGVYASNLRRPCGVSILGDNCAVAELESRVTILDKQGTPVAFLGDNPNKKHWANFKVKPEEQKVGIFSAPHGLSFDKDGNLYVQDWNVTGRATRLELIK